MNMATWYEVCVNITSGEGIQDSSAVGTLEQAKRAIERFRAMYPKAHTIFVRQHPRNAKPQRPYRVLHTLTVRDGMTVNERRTIAAQSVGVA